MRGDIGVGIIGYGTVGVGTAAILMRMREKIEREVRATVSLAHVADIDATKADAARTNGAERFSTDGAAVIEDAAVDIVVELIGGVEPARSFVLAALAAGKSVVTANKELLSTHGAEVFDAAAAAGRDILFEASVGGGIPLVKPLKENLVGNRFSRVMGIVNGTTNYVLSRMSEDNMAFDEALSEAQARGYAEPDPRADIEGMTPLRRSPSSLPSCSTHASRKTKSTRKASRGSRWQTSHTPRTSDT